ncbi:MAG: YqaE/Pmp3 family membrane protein [Rhodospirillaceae bacterium]|nr:YqaE/Pmp3 family membrane protein [Rhodospirillaceae bacterium]MCA8934214.1 YqaE/Pmp3 family membrane protein [Rhodospirillaceae bacterium]
MAHTSNSGTGDSLGGDLFRIVLAILLPPLGVFLEVGLTKQFWLNVLLTLLGYLPGIVHAVWVIARR